MSVMGIVRGDTLSEIAARIGSTVAALAQENGITNPNFIREGDSLKIPGGGSGGGGQGSTGVDGTGAVGGTGAVTGTDASAIAKSFLGRNASELKLSDDIPMADWVPNNVNCANFVSGCLQKAGVIGPGQASASVRELANNLEGAGWQQTSLQNAKPGDVVVMDGHVVLFAGMENGKPTFIGSNNANPDGSQRVTMGGASGDYRILTPPG